MRFGLNFKDFSLKQKIMSVIIATSLSALILSSVLFLAHEIFTYRQKLSQDLETISDVVADTSTSAFLFDDNQAAEDILRGLRVKKNIIYAAFYLNNGDLFASYKTINAPEKVIFPIERYSGVSFKDGKVFILKKVPFENGFLGYIYIISDLSDIRWIVWRDLLTGLIALFTCLIVVFIISSRLQKILYDTILYLASMARKVSLQKDYSIRVVKQNKDEVGLLMDAFNDMLSQIQKRDAALLQSHNEIERQVKERTEELRDEILHHEKTADQLRQTANELERSNKELEQFASIASHDLQEPLRKIANYTNLLAKRYNEQLDERGGQFMNYIVDGATRMQTLISDLLSYSRVGKSELVTKKINLEDILKQVITDLEHTIQENHAKISYSNLPTVVVNFRQIGQVFQNLISNAIKFRGDVNPVVRIIAEKRDKEWVICVKDNGIGIEPQYQDKIFIIFQRLHTRQEYPGTGIGLAICKKIIERHNGRIWMESEYGKGSSFYFTLPVVDENMIVVG